MLISPCYYAFTALVLASFLQSIFIDLIKKEENLLLLVDKSYFIEISFRDD